LESVLHGVEQSEGNTPFSWIMNMSLQHRNTDSFFMQCPCFFRGKMLLLSQQSFFGLSREISSVSYF
jgi:hypothetical protein